jgi:allene oxide cyclase-like protein
MAAAIRKHPRWASALLGAAVALAVAVPLVLSTGAAAQAPPAQTRVQFTIFDRDDTGATHPLDLGKAGFPSPGDFVLENHAEYDPHTKTRIGYGITQIQVIHAFPNGDFLGIIHCTIVLSDGRIQFDGGFRFSKVNSSTGDVVPVTGGTGVYRDTSGSVKARIGSIGGHPGAYLAFDILKAT